MIQLIFAGPWVKASAFTDLAALSLGDVIVARYGPTVEHQIVCQRIERPLVYDAAEDRAYWSAKHGRELSEVEHLEIRANLVGFIRALLAPGARLQ
ncbi:MAG: hypothetical protein A2X35_09260 [Elusimicrobia bacterium GWA2_61_42]|nr:MAG: hypothetical protein A2X35_09260 [Elusimicrobia bacterium GWA2_61_42]